MGIILQIVLFSFTGLFLLWFGYTLFFAFPGAAQGRTGAKPRTASNGEIPRSSASSGAPKTCPLCCIRLEQGERVKSIAFPSMGGADRFMHISGCYYCLEEDRRRVCPVCGSSLDKDEYLIAKYYEKPVRSHVHVIGCSRCKLRRV